MLTIRVFLLAILVMNPLRHYSQDFPTDYLSDKADIGTYEKAGNSSYDAEEQLYHLESPISPEYGEHFVYRKVSGNFLFTADLTWEGEVPGNSQLGLMMVNSLENSTSSFSKFKDTLSHKFVYPYPIHFYLDSVNHAELQISSGWHSEINGSPVRRYRTFQLERLGDQIIFRAAGVGEPMQEIFSKEMSELEEEVFIGLFIKSSDDEKAIKAKAWNVRIDQPVQKGYDAYEEGFLASRLETLNVFTGERKIIHEHRGKLEAPNWMPDGEKLLYNQDGHIYTISLEGGEPQQLDTGLADRNNNDHGISFDGKVLAISHHRENMPAGGSTVYVLALEGGEPKLVTEHTPSYWHGWSPDNEFVIYVAKREGDERYNIFRKSIHGGEEEQLTDIAEGEHVDGCEYDPAGEYIYYNGSHSGSMQIWRMKPDGSAGEQLTFEETNNWFPHISPDGKWMVYLAYPADIPLNAHPFYQRVSLKLMPLDGGAPRTIAYLYGGQGTINVPSWSPDSKHVAFVSNSRK
ncbi:MAG: hypothetical protein AAF388_19590 [Bacteroidota bacterium]